MVEVVQLKASGDTGEAIDGLDSLSASLSNLDAMAHNFSTDMFRSEIEEAAAAAAVGRKEAQSLEDAIRSQGKAAVEAASKGNTFLDYLRNTEKEAKRADNEVKALIKDLKQLSTQTVKGQDPFKRAKRSGLKGPGGGVPLPGQTIKETAKAVEEAGKRAGTSSVDFDKLATSMRDMDGVGLRLADGVDQLGVLMSGPLGLAIGATILGVGALVLGVKAAIDVVSTYIQTNQHAATEMASFEASLDRTKAAAGGVAVESTALTSVLEGLAVLVEQDAGHFLEMSAAEARASDESARLQGTVTMLGFALGPLVGVLFSATGAANSLANALGAAGRNAAFARQQAAFLKAGGEQFEKDFGRLSAGDDAAGKEFLKQRAEDAANAVLEGTLSEDVARERVAGFDKALTSAMNEMETRRIATGDGTGGLISGPLTQEGRLSLPKAPGGGGGGGGGKRDPFKEIQASIQAASASNAELRAFEKMLATGPINQLRGALTSLDDRYHAITDQIQQYGFVLDQVADKKVAAKIRSQIDDLTAQQGNLEENMKRLRQAEVDRLSETRQELIDDLGEGLDKLTPKMVNLIRQLKALPEFGRVKAQLDQAARIDEIARQGTDTIRDRITQIMDRISRLKILMQSAVDNGLDDVAEATKKKLSEAQRQLSEFQAAAKQAEVQESNEAIKASFQQLADDAGTSLGQLVASTGEAGRGMQQNMAAATDVIIPFFVGLASAYIAAAELNPFALFAATFALKALAGAASTAFSGGSSARTSSSGRGAGSRRQLSSQGEQTTVINLDARFGTKQIQAEVEGMVSTGAQRGRVRVQPTGRRRVG